MGMDLIGCRLSYNWAGWRWLTEHLEMWGVDGNRPANTSYRQPALSKGDSSTAEARSAATPKLKTGQRRPAACVQFKARPLLHCLRDPLHRSLWIFWRQTHSYRHSWPHS